MPTPPPADLHQTPRTEFTSLFGSTKLVLDETPKAITPFGGLASFLAFLGQIGYAQEVQQALPFAVPTSHNAIPLAHTLTAFVMAVVTVAQRFAHCQWLRADHVLHALLGLERFPGDGTIRNFFLRFSQAHIEAFWRPLWRWLLRLLACPQTGFSLDLDSTVFCREGRQEGAAKGYNPRRKGRESHHPLLAVPAEAPFILHGWLRSGNTGAARGVVPFLQEALALLPEGTWIRCVRADSGFFEEALLSFREARKLPYVVVARLTVTLKRRCAGIKEWTVIDANYAVGEFTAQLFGWSQARRFVVLRERVREGKDAVGRRLLDVPGYTFLVWVANRSEGALALRFFRRQGCVRRAQNRLVNFGGMESESHSVAALLGGVERGERREMEPLTAAVRERGLAAIRCRNQAVAGWRMPSRRGASERRRLLSTGQIESEWPIAMLTIGADCQDKEVQLRGYSGTRKRRLMGQARLLDDRE
jgi:hypothetical protein